MSSKSFKQQYEESVEKVGGMVDFDLRSMLRQVGPERSFQEPLGPTEDCLSIEQIRSLAEGEGGLTGHAAECRECGEMVRVYLDAAPRGMPDGLYARVKLALAGGPAWRQAAAAGYSRRSAFWEKLAANVPVRIALAAACICLMAGGLETAYRNSMRTSQTLAGLPADSIAVVAFQNSGGPEQQYLSDGITESLVANLGGTSGLRVTKVSAATGPLEFARELPVSAFLTGRVIQSDNGLVVSAQLIRARDNQTISEKQYVIDPAGVASFQTQITRSTLTGLNRTLTSRQSELLASRYPDQRDVYELYMKGRYFWNQRTQKGLEDAIRSFEEAIRKDPDYALAYSGVADCYSLLGWYSWLPRKEAYTKARDAAQRALIIDGDLAEGHASLALIKSDYDWDWRGAEQEYRRAIELAPGYATAHQWYALFLAAMGRPKEARTQISRAQELEPASVSINTTVGEISYYARSYDQAIEQYRKTLKLAPDALPPKREIGRAYTQKKMYKEAIDAFKEVLSRAPSESSKIAAHAALGYVYAVSGQRSLADQEIAALRDPKTGRPASSYHLAMIYAGMKEKDLAFEWLERAFDERSGLLVYLKIDPRLDNLRADARFQSLLGRMNYPKS